MAIEKNIRVTADTSQAEASIKKLGDEIDNTTEKTEEAKGSMSGITGTLDKVTGGAVSKLKGFAGGLKGVALGFKSVGAAIAASGIGLLILVIAGITAAFKGSEEGQNKFAKLMGVIGAVVGNVVDVLADFGDFVIDLFSGDGKAMNALKSFGQSIFNVIGLPIKNAIDTVKALGKAISALASGDITGAMSAVSKGASDVKQNFDEAKGSILGATDALKGFVQQNVEEGKAAAKVADQRAKADIIERNLIVEKAKAEREIAELRLKAKDLNNVSAKEREAALLKVLDIQDDLITKETEVLTLRRDAQIAENGFARSNKENLDAEENAKAAVIAAETRRTDQKRQIQRELTAAENEQNATRKAAAKEAQALADEAAKLEKDRLKSISDFRNELVKKDEDNDAKTQEEKLELERTRAEEKLERLIGDEEEKREALLALNLFYDQKEDELEATRIQEKKDKDAQDLIDAQVKADKEAAITAKKIKEEEDLEKFKKDFVIGQALLTLNIIGSLAKEGSAVAKGAAVAQATIKTYEGAVAAYAAGSSIAGPVGVVMGPVAAGLAVTAGLINIKKILSTKANSTSAPSGGGGGGGRPSIPQAPSFNLVQGSASNQIANSVQTGTQPVRSFVVSSDITSNQALDRRIEEGSTL